MKPLPFRESRYGQVFFASVQLANPLKGAQHDLLMKTNIAPRAPSCLGLVKADGASNVHLTAEAYGRRLARIEAALARMDAGRYGFCLACEGRIGLTRLENDPAEAVCETCDTQEGEDA